MWDTNKVFFSFSCALGVIKIMNGDDSEKKVPHGREQLWDAGWKSWDSPLTKTWSQTLGTGVHIWGDLMKTCTFYLSVVTSPEKFV